MPDFNDRRNAIGSGDFNNPAGTFALTTPGDTEWGDWQGQPTSAENRRKVHQYFGGQKDTQTWSEANRLAKRRAEHEMRKHGTDDLASYADSYQEHLVRVMAVKGHGMAEGYGEVGHRQGGYGRV